MGFDMEEFDMGEIGVLVLVIAFGILSFAFGSAKAIVDIRESCDKLSAVIISGEAYTCFKEPKE
jgi:hypothetical protein